MRARAALKVKCLRLLSVYLHGVSHDKEAAALAQACLELSVMHLPRNMWQSGYADTERALYALRILKILQRRFSGYTDMKFDRTAQVLIRAVARGFVRTHGDGVVRALSIWLLQASMTPAFGSIVTKEVGSVSDYVPNVSSANLIELCRLRRDHSGHDLLVTAALTLAVKQNSSAVARALSA